MVADQNLSIILRIYKNDCEQHFQVVRKVGNKFEHYSSADRYGVYCCYQRIC